MYQDILLNEDGTPQVVNSDFVVGASDGQHIPDILLSRPGDWKEHPLLGVDLLGFVNGPDTRANRVALQRAIRLNLEADGFALKSVVVDSISNPQIETIN